MIFDLLIPPRGHKGAGPKNAVAHSIYVSNSHTKFGWIASNGLGGDRIWGRRTDGQRQLQYPLQFKKSVAIKKN